MQQDWLEEHRQKLRDLAATLVEIVDRLDSLGEEVQQRVQSDEYLALVRRAFRTWDQASTEEKRRLIKNLLMNAGGTSLCPDDLIRLFIQWIDYYHDAHSEADLFKLLIRDLSTGSVIRQHRETTADGQFVRKQPFRRPKGFGASRVMKSAFDDSEQYELTELGQQFVHYTMNDVVPRIGSDDGQSGEASRS